jgi:4,5-DOPA dioxygenase extradiol
MNNSTRMPVVFLGHGSPVNILMDNKATRTWARIARKMPRPKAILCVSAHWLTEGTAVTAMTHPRTIHDFGRSLPAPLFDCQYPAPGDPILADRVRELLAPTPVVMDQSWGLDHATWSVLSKAYPDADVPVVQFSMDGRHDPAARFDVGRRLKPLRDEGVLIVGSGNVTHNLGVMDPNENATPFDWAARFRDYTYKAIADDAPERLIDYQSQGRDAELAVADPNHFWPLLYVLGARDQGDRVAFESDFIQYGSLSMMNVVFDGRET